MKKHFYSHLILFVLLLSFSNVLNASPNFLHVVTEHEILINDKPIEYQTTVGLMPIYNQDKKLIATMSYFAYHVKKDKHTRPITFVWAGGPGNSSLPCNFLVSGPKIVNLKTGKMETNSSTWLRFTDLVYIDMVGSGWGRPTHKVFAKTLFTPNGDANSFTSFIKNYLNTIKFHYSGIYLAGISYGGYRVTLVANKLMKNFVKIKGLILQSPLLWPSYSFGKYDDVLSYVMALPTYIYVALHYNKLSPAFEKNQQQTINEGINWAMTKYPSLLLKGTQLTKEEQQNLVSTLHSYTGLSLKTIRNNNFRIPLSIFRKKLLASKNKIVDYTNGKMNNYPLLHHYGLYILSMPSVINSLTSLYKPAMHYINHSLKVDGPNYYINYFDPSKVWHSSNKQVVSILRDNMVINKKLKLLVAVGYYDTDIPYKVTETAIYQMFPMSLTKRIKLYYFLGGHMFSINAEIRDKFNQDVHAFFK